MQWNPYLPPSTPTPLITTTLSNYDYPQKFTRFCHEWKDDREDFAYICKVIYTKMKGTFNVDQPYADLNLPQITQLLMKKWSHLYESEAKDTLLLRQEMVTFFCSLLAQHNPSMNVHTKNTIHRNITVPWLHDVTNLSTASSWREGKVHPRREPWWNRSSMMKAREIALGLRLLPQEEFFSDAINTAWHSSFNVMERMLFDKSFKEPGPSGRDRIADQICLLTEIISEFSHKNLCKDDFLKIQLYYQKVLKNPHHAVRYHGPIGSTSSICTNQNPPPHYHEFIDFCLATAFVTSFGDKSEIIHEQILNEFQEYPSEGEYPLAHIVVGAIKRELINDWDQESLVYQRLLNYRGVFEDVSLSPTIQDKYFNALLDGRLGGSKRYCTEALKILHERPATTLKRKSQIMDALSTHLAERE